MKRILIKFSALFLLLNISLKAQDISFNKKIEAYHKSFPTEKLYLSFDKSYYTVGDTLWFKSFLLNGDLTTNKRTDKIYVELFNDSLTLIDNRVIALNNGLGYGDFALTNKLREGTYTIRAYSNWQQNFGNDYFFQKSFGVGKVGDRTWLVDSYQMLNTSKKALDLKIKITNIKNEAVGLKDVEIYLLNNKKKLMKADLQTSVDGIVETQIPLGQNKITGDYSLLITDRKDKTWQSILPISLQGLDQVDLQFMPEGGFMVNDIFGRVAFKAIGADGMGMNISGKIVNNKNELVTTLTSAHKGMGSFYLMPKSGDTYFALFNLNGKEQRQQLPLAREEGTTLRIDQFSKPDSVYVYIKASEAKRLENYQLLAMMGNETIMSSTINLRRGLSTIKLTKLDFPDGIIHFILISPDQQPLNERQVFINRDLKINLQAKLNKNNYAIKDSINLEIMATKENGLPLSGTFSVSITDDRQVIQDNETNIVSHFLLKSDLKGNIEDAAWYFNNQNPSTLFALDHLLLTQAWVGYQWNDILQNGLAPKFKAEKGNSIEGSLTNLFKKPVPNINLTLMSLGKNIFVTDTVSNSNGEFLFNNLPYLDSAAFTIKIKNPKGKTASANIFVNEFIPAKEINYMSRIKPWYVNTDSTTLHYYQNIEKIKTPIDKQKLVLEGTMLNEVEIKGQIKLKNFIEKTAWDAHFVKNINEDELKKNSGKKLKDLLYEKIDGFTIGTPRIVVIERGIRYTKPGYRNYFIGNSLISHIMIDNINTHVAASGIDDQYNSNINGKSKTAEDPDIFSTNELILNTLNAEDIKDITVYKGQANYFLDITTRSGKGPWIVKTPGMYIYKPLPIYIAKEFYSPKYNANNNTTAPDYRSTIFWDANVVTDENGKAKISFYAADKPSIYTIRIEGTDLLGRFGYQKSSIKIINKTDSK